jgi:hypothetical protein
MILLRFPLIITGVPMTNADNNSKEPHDIASVDAIESNGCLLNETERAGVSLRAEGSDMARPFLF